MLQAETCDQEHRTLSYPILSILPEIFSCSKRGDVDNFFQMLIEWTVVRYVQSFDKLYSQIRKHHIRNLKFQLEQIKFE